MKYFIVDAFSSHPFGGNTAGVVLLDNDVFPDESLMLRVAAELRYSETAFVRKDAPNEFTVRYFTPLNEVDLCGHATIASFATMHSLGIAGGTCLVHTLAGDITVKADATVMMQMATPSIVKRLDAADTSEVYRALGIAVPKLISKIPVEIVSTGLPDIMLCIDSINELNTLQPNMDAVAAIPQRLGAISLHPYAFGSDGYTAHVRDFAPACGIPEESATGTANASLTHHLAIHGLVKPDAQFKFLQGEAMGRPSVVETCLTEDGSVWVGGPATIVAEGKLLV